MNATEIHAEKAIEKLEFAIRAAKNGNQGGENAVVKYSRAFRVHDELLEALETATAMLRTLVPEDISVRETLARNEAILARARGEGQP